VAELPFQEWSRKEITMPFSKVYISSLFNNIMPGYNCRQLVQQNFQQLTGDLQSGNLSAAQSDSAVLNRLLPQFSTLAPAQSSSPLGQAINQLSQDLGGGNLSAAETDCSTIQQYFQEAGIIPSTTQPGGNGGLLSPPTMPLSKAYDSYLFNNIMPGYNCRQLVQQNFQQLGVDLQSGNLSAAQSDSAVLNRLLPQFSTLAPAQSSSRLGQAINQLSQDLGGGNLSAAATDYSTIQQYFQEARIIPGTSSVQNASPNGSNNLSVLA
jgi:hypothetical protein